MCGIAGIVSNDGDIARERPVLENMCRLLQHRGPDDEGYYLNGAVGFGMRRLSIIDLETGHQPITNEDESVWLIFNGEIYNYRELRAELSRQGHHFQTQSDSEVIVHAYEAYGVECLTHFNGMFALAIWDARRQQLFLARDRLGIKPLYYWSSPERIVFGSELKAVVAHPMVPREIDHLAMDHFLTLEYIPTPRTIYREVNKLPAGSWLTFDVEGLVVKQYWDVPHMDMPGDEPACIEQLQELIDDAVRLRLVSDVPLGAFLSGGIDSSTVVAAMRQAAAMPVRTFSIGFEEASYNELPFARQVARHLETDHFEEILEPDIAQLASELVGHLDEPFGDFSIFPTYLVSKVARQQVKVVLSGDGGDELFGGYDTYVAQQADIYYRWLPRLIREQALPAVMRKMPPQPAKKGLVNKAKRFVEGAAYAPGLMHARWMIFLSDREKEALYQPDLQAYLDGQSVEKILLEHFRRASGFDTLARQQYVDIKTYLVDDILTKVDRMSMAASLEARVPLLDHRIVSFALNLPQEMKLHRGKTKRILRQAMKGRLPGAIFDRPKQGFSIPIKHWLRGPLKPLMLELLSDDCVRKRGYFRPDVVQSWVADHLEARVNHSHRLWSLMVLEMWHQRFVDGVHVAD